MNTGIKNIPQLRFSEFKEKYITKQLNSFSSFYSGGTPTSTNKSYYQGYIPFIGSGNINDKCVDKFVTQKAIDSSSAKMVEVGDLLYALYGATSGEVAISKINGAINQAILCIRPTENKHYLYQILSFNKNKITSKYLQGGQGNLSANIIKNISFHFPTLPEQQKIASFLSAVDTKIEQLTKKKELLEKYKKGIMQKIFSQVIRFKDDKGNNYPNWIVKKLGEIASFSKGKGLSKSDIDDNGISECIRYGELYTNYNETIINVVSKTNYPIEKATISEINDIIIPASGETQIDIATASCILKDGIILGSDLNIIKTNANGVFLAYYLNSAKKFDIARLSQGSSVIHLYSSQLALLKLEIPIKEEQTKIANFLTSIDDKINQASIQLEKTQEFKKALLQQMFV